MRLDARKLGMALFVTALGVACGESHQPPPPPATVPAPAAVPPAEQSTPSAPPSNPAPRIAPADSSNGHYNWQPGPIAAP